LRGGDKPKAKAEMRVKWICGIDRGDMRKMDRLRDLFLMLGIIYVWNLGGQHRWDLWKL
jgi:hypothetical protein